MTKTCTCPDDPRTIPKEDRVELVEPNAVIFVDGKKIVDRTKFHVFHRNCPIHGYSEILDE